MSEADYDCVIVGAGLAGACAACALPALAGFDPARVGWLAPAWPMAPPAGAPPALRVVALSRASERLLGAAGIWQRLAPERLCAYERMLVWRSAAVPRAEASLLFDAAAIGEPNLGHIVENEHLLGASHAAASAAGVALLRGELRALQVDAKVATLTLADGRTLRTRLVVGADGAESGVRRLANLPVREHDYAQRAIVAVVRGERPAGATAWQRFVLSGPVALLPLFDGSASLVWSADRALAERLEREPERRFEEELTQAIGGALGALRLVSARGAFALRSLAALRYVAPRVALVGDAAHVIHPLAGQGANLGLLDVAALAATLREGRGAEDVGALRLLRAYEQRRYAHNRAADTAMSLLRTLFRADGPVGGWVLERGLSWVNALEPVKALLAREALGQGAGYFSGI